MILTDSPLFHSQQQQNSLLHKIHAAFFFFEYLNNSVSQVIVCLCVCVLIICIIKTVTFAFEHPKWKAKKKHTHTHTIDWHWKCYRSKNFLKPYKPFPSKKRVVASFEYRIFYIKHKVYANSIKRRHLNRHIERQHLNDNDFWFFYHTHYFFLLIP